MSAAREHTLNAALADLQIDAWYEDWLAIVDRFYDERVQVSSDARQGRLIGRAGLTRALVNILAPLHTLAHADGTSVSLRCLPIYADRHHEHHSAWSLDIVGPSGRPATVQWCVRRIWRGELVVHEHYYENDVNGRALAVEGFWIPAAAASLGARD
jgi:hypothetical protein